MLPAITRHYVGSRGSSNGPPFFALISGISLGLWFLQRRSAFSWALWGDETPAWLFLFQSFLTLASSLGARASLALALGRMKEWPLSPCQGDVMPPGFMHQLSLYQPFPGYSPPITSPLVAMCFPKLAPAHTASLLPHGSQANPSPPKG